MELDPSCEIKEECGIFGIFAKEGTEAAPSIYYGLCALQHRGQESCGIAVSDTTGPKGNMSSHKDLGLVNEVFKEETLHSLHGNLGIGHVRYSTTGGNSASNAQPLVLNYVKGTLALAHNGNLVNTEELRREFEENGAIFHTTTDSEVIAYCVARERVHSTSVEEAIKKYKDNNDWLSQFLDECCEVGDTSSAKSGDVYNAYRSYCAQVGDYVRSTTDFYTALECAGFERKRCKSARMLFGLNRISWIEHRVTVDDALYRNFSYSLKKTSPKRSY